MKIKLLSILCATAITAAAGYSAFEPMVKQPVAKQVLPTPGSEESYTLLANKRASHATKALQTNDAIPEGMCEIILEAHDVYSNGFSGYQLLLDSDHSTYNSVFWSFSSAFFGDYSQFEYKIPEDAEPLTTTDKVLVDGTVSMYIPAGVYDWMIVQPNAESLTFPAGDFAKVDDYELFEGKSYKLYVEYRDGDSGARDYVDFIVENDMAISSLQVPATGMGLTASETISVDVVNNGVEAQKNFKLCYSINGGDKVEETVTETVEAGATYSYTFATKADFSAGGVYEVTASVEADGDMIPSNNSMSASCRNLVAEDLPYSCNFSELGSNNFESEWIIVNSEGSYNGWQFSDWMANENGEYGCASCSTGNNGSDDDWLISLPMNMSAGTNHVRFSHMGVNASYTEIVEVCMGSTPEPEDMQLLATFEISEREWVDRVVNFNVSADGVYYIAFHAVSKNGLNQFIGTVDIDAGEFVGTPKPVFTKVLLPYSNSDLPSDAKVGVSIINKGTAAMSNYTLTCVVNGGEPISTTFTDEIAIFGSADLYIDTPFDFSAVGKYTVEFTLTSEGDDVSVTNTIECFNPVTELPLLTDFSTQANYEYWTMMTADSWEYDTYFQTFCSEAHGIDNGLLSRGIYMEKSVRMRVQYVCSGWGGTTTLAVYLGKAGADISTYEKVFEDKETTTTSKETEFIVTVDTPGNYSFVIADEGSMVGENIRLGEVEISNLSAYDLRINDVDAPISAYTPIDQVNAKGTYYVTVENRGSEAMTGVKVKALVDGVEYSTSPTLASLASGEVSTIEWEFAIENKAVGDKFVLSFSVDGDNDDAYTADNTKTLSTVTITDAMRSTENITDPQVGTGGYWTAISIGNIYNLPCTDDLTSVTIGFSYCEEDTENAKSTVAMNIYPVNTDGSLGKRIYRHEMTRGTGGFVDIDMPDMRLSAGLYFFEMEQSSMYNMGLAYEADEAAVCHQNVNGVLNSTHGYSLCIRANFAADAKVYAKDAYVKEITSPTYTSGLYSDSQAVTALVRNNGYEDASFDVELLINGTKHSAQSVELASYDEQEVEFSGVDMSKPGIYELQCKAVLADDTNAENDAVSVVCTANEEVDPYVMDFESCNDFDANGEIFNPRWTTVSRYESDTDYFWAYQHKHRGEACGFIAFNPGATVPSMLADEFPGMSTHSGERIGLAFCYMQYTTNYQGQTETDAWIISPKLKLGTGSSFEMYAKTRYLEYVGAALEPYEVLVSETDTNFDSFTRVGEDRYLAPDEDWGLTTIDLSAYDGKEIHVAVRYLGGANNVCLMIDDLRVKTELTGVENITSKSEVIAVNYYDPCGRPVTENAKGLLIKVSTFKDGTKSVSKVVK